MLELTKERQRQNKDTECEWCENPINPDIRYVFELKQVFSFCSITCRDHWIDHVHGLWMEHKEGEI